MSFLKYDITSGTYKMFYLNSHGQDIELYNWGNSFITTVDIVADKPKEELEGLAIGFPINSSSGSEGSTIIFPKMAPRAKPLCS